MKQQQQMQPTLLELEANKQEGKKSSAGGRLIGKTGCWISCEVSLPALLHPQQMYTPPLHHPMPCHLWICPLHLSTGQHQSHLHACHCHYQSLMLACTLSLTQLCAGVSFDVVRSINNTRYNKSFLQKL